MPQGLQVWNADGSLQIDTNTNLGRFLGTVETGGVNGSLDVPGFAQGTPWFLVMLLGVASYNTFVPQVTIAGNTISWNYTSGNFNALIYFGVY